MLDIKELEKIMIENGLAIRAIPTEICSVYETYHKERFPDGEIQYLPQYNREMLVVKKTLKLGGKFIVQAVPHSCSIVKFTAPKFYESIEELIDDIQSK